MSSSACTPQEGQVLASSVSTQAQPSDSSVIGSSVGPQGSAVVSTLSGQSLRGPDAGPTPQVPASPTPLSVTSTTGPPPVGGFSTPISRSNDLGATEVSQDSVRAKFVGSAGYIVPAPSFSYSVFPRVNSTSANPQQSVSSPVVRITPPVPPSALQPPVPGQSSALRPSFSYNVISQSSNPATSQQFQPSTAMGNTGLQGKTLMPSLAAPALQSSVPGQPPATSSTLPGTTKQSPPNLVQLPPSSFSYSGNSQSGVVDSLEKAVLSNLNTSSAVAAEPVGATTASFSSQSMQMPAPMPPNFSTNLPSSPNLNPAAVQTSVVSSFPRPPMMPGNAGPGPSRLASSVSPSAAAVRPVHMDSPSARPILPSPASTPLHPVSAPVPIPQNLQQQNYPPHPSITPQAPPSQALWLHASHAGSLQHAPFLPYPGAIPAPFPLPMQGMPPPYGPLPSLQPPGVSIVVSGGAQSAATESGLPVNNFVAQSPPSGIDKKHATDTTVKDENNVKKEESDAWTAHKTDTGAVYYYNSLTGESTYEKPSCFKGEPGNVIAQPTPVSWEKLAGTDWTLVTTNDGKKYYYNSTTKVSSWQIPPEVAGMKKNEDDDRSKESANSIQNASMTSDKGLSNVSLNAPAVQTGGRDAATSKTPGALISSSALDLIKKKLQDAGTPVTSSPLPSPVQTLSDLGAPKAIEATTKIQHSETSKDKLKDTNGDANISESSSDSDDADSGPTKDECIVQFKEMLKERGVAPFSKWEKELPKIIFDPRFKSVQSHSVRRSLFEHYVRTRAEEERKEKRAAQKAAIEGFKQLLDEASEDINHKTDYQAFKRKWGNDPRFEALGRKERELLLSERVNSLKKVVEEKIQAIRADFKSMLRERAEITASSRWSRVKDNLRNDPRYRSVKHEDREVFFNEYISELKAAEAEAQLAAKAKMEENEKLKKREQDMRKIKQREEQEMEAVRLRVRRKEAESSYQALLVETIKDPKASWTESKQKLEKDPQGRAANPDLDQADMEKLFREHVKNLYERCAREYRALLSEVITAEAAARVTDDGKTVLTSWSEAKKLLKRDPRYSKMPSKDRESLWSRYADDMRRKLKSTSDPKDRLDVERKGRASSTDLGGRSPKRSRSSRQI